MVAPVREASPGAPWAGERVLALPRMLADDPPVRIRRITPNDGPVLRDLRVRSLSDAPDAFGQTVEEAAGQPDSEWVALARAAAQGERRAWFLAELQDAGTRPEEGPSVVGLVLGRRRPPDTLLIFSMWVDPSVRRGGVGRALIDRAESWAAGWGARRSVLWVFAANEPAIRFYLRLGFRTEMEGDDARTGANYGALAMSRPIPPAATR
jgi:GNAT superfamily N-acetyltransferase